jgi:hypothetical protein
MHLLLGRHWKFIEKQGNLLAISLEESWLSQCDLQHEHHDLNEGISLTALAPSENS